MKDIRLDSPLEGELIPLSDVQDPVFGSGAMGRGAAVKNPKGKVYAPFDGERKRRRATRSRRASCSWSSIRKPSRPPVMRRRRRLS